MESVDMQVLDAARRWAAEGRRLALVTVAHTWGSAPRPAGSWLVLRDDGLTVGSVSGGCVEDDLIARMRDGRLAGQRPFPLTYGVTKDEAERYGLPCGGTLELIVEPAPDAAQLDDLAARLGRGELAMRTIDLAQGGVVLAAAQPGASLRWDGERLRTVHGPQWRLLIVGAGQISHYLAPMARALDYEVTICEPRVEYGAAWEIPGTRLVTAMPDDALLAMRADARCAVVALTHDPKLDDLVLLEALRSPAFYVGAVGSRLNDSRRRERLAQHFDFSPAELARLHGPIGLPIGSHTPPEIAVAIIAEITAVRHRAPIARRDVPQLPPMARPDAERLAQQDVAERAPQRDLAERITQRGLAQRELQRGVAARERAFAPVAGLAAYDASADNGTCSASSRANASNR